MLKAIKIRLYPNSDQQTEMNKLLGSCRFVYNHCLDAKISAYTGQTVSLNISDLNREIVELKKKEEYLWLKEAHSKVIQQSILNLDMAYKNFFKNKKGFPKFKSKHGNDSCRFPVDAIIGVDGNRFNLITKLKNVLFKCSVKDEKFLNKKQSNIKSATLSKTKSGEYFLSVLIDGFIPKSLSPIENTTGIDLGIKYFVIQSNGNKFENIKIKRANEKKLIKLNRKLSRKQKGSKNKNKARIILARFHKKINNKKEYYLHHVANRLLNENQVIAMESLNIKGMMKNHNLARSIQELSLGKFKSILQYKSLWYEKHIIEIDTFFSSSKLCNECNYKNQNLKLSDREWVCPCCGIIHDRDINAAINIKKEGLRLYLLNQKQEQIGLSKPELTPVESSTVDDPIRRNSDLLKSTFSKKQEDKIMRFVNENTK